MSRHEFEEFLRRHEEEEIKEQEQVNWNERKKEWVKHIKDFYQTVTVWLMDYVEKDKVTITRVATTVNEEPVGTYKTHTLILKVANQEVRLSPVGTVLIGARGRIDMESETGTVKFLLVDEKLESPLGRMGISADKRSKSKKGDEKRISWTWKIATPPPSVRYISLNEESFFDALMELINA